MKVYLASWFASKEEIKKRAGELQAVGIEVTSRWLDEKIKGTVQIKDVAEDYLRETAQVDIQDILLANVLVLNVPTEDDLKFVGLPVATWARGGRHFESGFHYATMVFFEYLPEKIKNYGARCLILVGHRENVFHYLDNIKVNGLSDGFKLPEIHTFETWDLAKEFLTNAAKNLQYETTESLWQSTQ